MDQERIGTLTKHLATGQTRRSMVKTLGATALGALGLSRAGALARQGKLVFASGTTLAPATTSPSHRAW